MACLFCLKILPKGKDHEFLEETVTTENGGEFTLKISLKNPAKNLDAFNCLCTLLKVKWRRSCSDEDDNDGEDNNQAFDIRRPLPLCRRCQQGYQEVYQLYQQIRELEVLMVKRAKVIKQTIEDTETGGLRLTCEKLNEFRKMALASSSSLPKSNLLDSSGDEDGPGSPDELMSEPDADDDHYENGQDLELNDPSTALVIPKRVSHRIKIEGEKKRRIIKKPSKPNTTTTNLTLRRNKSRKESTSTTKIITATIKKGSVSPSTLPSLSSSLSRSSMQPRNVEDTSQSPFSTSTTTPTPKKKRSGRRSKLERVTESTPKIHVDCFTCCYCGLRLKTTGGLSMHRKFHEPPTFGCPLCPKMFANNYQMKRHLKGVHKNEQAPASVVTPSPPAPAKATKEESSDEHAQQ